MKFSQLSVDRDFEARLGRHDVHRENTHDRDSSAGRALPPQRCATPVFPADTEAANLVSIATTKGRSGPGSATTGAVLGAGGGLSDVGLERHDIGPRPTGLSRGSCSAGERISNAGPRVSMASRWHRPRSRADLLSCGRRWRQQRRPQIAPQAAAVRPPPPPGGVETLRAAQLVSHSTETSACLDVAWHEFCLPVEP